MKNFKTTSLLQVLFFEIIICARGHGIIPLLFFKFLFDDVPSTEKNIIIGLIISEMIAIIILLLNTFGNLKRGKLFLFVISTISFSTGLIFLLIFNGAETIYIPIITSIPFYFMTFRTYKNLFPIEN